MKEFDLGILSLNENHRHAVFRQGLRLGDICAKRPVSGNGGFEIGHRDGDVIQSSEHGHLPLTRSA